MDGNNRYSKKKNISQFDGYKAGANKLLKLSKYIFENFETDTISAFALSYNNTKRPRQMLNTLINVLEFFLSHNSEEYVYDFKIIFRGNLDFLSKKILKKIYELESISSKFKKKLVVYVNYSGRLDILNAISNSNLKSTKISLKQFNKLLITKNIPDPDILIRTGGYQRISDFFLYQISFTELVFIKKLWPEINNSEILKILDKYKKTERKFGY